MQVCPILDWLQAFHEEPVDHMASVNILSRDRSQVVIWATRPLDATQFLKPRTQSCGPNYTGCRPGIQARVVSKRRRRGPPTLVNSARRHCISPRRGRRVKWRDRRRWVKWSDRRASRTSRRSACGASYKSVGNARSIDVTTTDVSLGADSV